MKKLFVYQLVLLVGLSLINARVWADSDQSAAVSASDIGALNNRLTDLEKSAVVLSTEHNYLDIATQKGDLVLKIGGVVQGDYRFYFAPRTTYASYLAIGSTA